jgi:hypothetical protein
MSKGSNPTNVTTTSEQEPSDYIRPYLDIAMDDAQALYQSDTPNFYPNATYVNFSPETDTALELTKQRALAGNPLLGSAQTEINNILSGNYLDPNSNPYASAMFNQMAGDVTSNVNSLFTKAGRFGSGANQEVLADSLGDLATKIYYNNYQDERNRMVDAVNVAPGLAQEDYSDIQALANVGASREDLEYAKLQDSINRFDYEQQKPYIKLNQYLGSLGSSVPTTTVETSPVYRNTGANILQGAGMGSDLGSTIGLGSGTGAILGGLLGGFF